VASDWGKLQSMSKGSELRIRTEDDADLAVTVGGQGPALVLCHGGPGLWDYFDSLRPSLDDLVTLISYDQRGCGRSSPGGPYTVSRYIEDLEAIRSTLGLSSWLVGGHSWGASLALVYALAHPERASALLYLSGTGLGRAWNAAYHEERDRRRQRYQTRMDELADRSDDADARSELRRLQWRSDLADPSLIDTVAEALDRPFEVNLEANAVLNAEVKTWLEPDLIEACHQLDQPVLVVHGREDPRPAWGLDSLMAALPHANLVVLDGVGHLPWLEAPEPTVRLMRQFLAGVA
jgi:proline iminopeptidase